MASLVHAQFRLHIFLIFPAILVKEKFLLCLDQEQESDITPRLASDRHRMLPSPLLPRQVIQKGVQKTIAKQKFMSWVLIL